MDRRQRRNRMFVHDVKEDTREHRHSRPVDPISQHLFFVEVGTRNLGWIGGLETLPFLWRHFCLRRDFGHPRIPDSTRLSSRNAILFRKQCTHYRRFHQQTFSPSTGARYKGKKPKCAPDPFLLPQSRTPRPILILPDFTAQHQSTPSPSPSLPKFSRGTTDIFNWTRVLR